MGIPCRRTTASCRAAFSGVLVVITSFVLVLSSCPSCYSQVAWSSSGVRVCQAAGNQHDPELAHDGAGGAFVAWEDDRDQDGTDDIYAQKVDSFGTLLWNEMGAGVCTATGDQGSPKVISDGSGGAIFTWEDGRDTAASGVDVYAQKVSIDGVAQWGEDGVLLSTGLGDDVGPAIAEDGDGGAIVAWQAGKNIYAQRVNANGGLAWVAGGVTICDADGTQSLACTIPDEYGGAIVAWQDGRSGTNDIYAQRVDSSGVTRWNHNGLRVSNAGGDQSSVRLASDGLTGAVVAWEDSRNVGSNGKDVYVQRIGPAGDVTWEENGVCVCDEPEDQESVDLITDDDGGAIVAWQDGRNAEPAVYAQRVDSSGEASWESNGVPVCDDTLQQENPKMAPDESGGAMVTFEGYLDGDSDIYYREVGHAGEPREECAVPVCDREMDQVNQRVRSVGSGNAVVVWEDSRDEEATRVYAQMMGAAGRLSSTYYFAEGTCRPGFDPYVCIQNPNSTEARIEVTYMRGNGTNEVQKIDVAGNSRKTISVKDFLGSGDASAFDFSAKVECVGGREIIAERPMYFNYQGYTGLNWPGGHDVVGATEPSSTFYFAEGTCRPGFDSYICVQNPSVIDAQVKITYMLGDSSTRESTFVVRAKSRQTVPVWEILGRGDEPAYDFSAKVECLSGQEIVAERPMYFDYRGDGDLDYRGGHDVVGATSTALGFYFAEGTCRPGFDSYICIQNPNGDYADVEITYMLGDSTSREQNVEVDPFSRETVVVKDFLGSGEGPAYDFSARVESTNGQPIIVERPMYFDYLGAHNLGWKGGHDVMGKVTPRLKYYFAEGTCRPGFEPYICIQNPNEDAVDVRITYMKGTGDTEEQVLALEGESRSTVVVKDFLGSGEGDAYDFSARVECTSDRNIIVERPMYFSYREGWPGYGGGWQGGHDVMGISTN